ncbi:MAG: peptide ABC transporter substrate-binding protein [Firmicutes bacterium]|nr:peptide ABC transporter substrate-binding protein [Bacillota bacterium]
MNTRRMALASGLALSFATLAAGCGLTSTATDAHVSPAVKPVKGATIVYALPTQTNINWYLPISNAADDSLYNFQLVDQLYMPLFYIGNNYDIDWADSIAKNVTYNSQGTVYHVFLNPKWKWSNGQPVTSADVLFTWNVIKAASVKNAPLPWPYVGAGTGDIPTGVKSVVATNKYEVTVTLKQPANQEWFIYNGLNQLTPMPTTWDKYPSNMTAEIKYLGSEATNWHFVANSVVDGPYKLVKAVSSQEWRLVPNTSFPGVKARDDIVFSYQTSSASEFAGLKTNAIQVGYLDLSDWNARGQLTNDRLFPTYGMDYFDIELNMQPNAQNGLGPVFQNLYVRQALEEAIPQQQIDTAVFHGFGPPQYGPIPTVPSTIYLAPQLKKPLYPYNLAKAKKLLTSHGWHLVNNVMTKDGKQLKFTLMYSSGSEEINQEMEIIAASWSQIGVQVNLKPTPFSSLIGTIDSSSQASKWDAAGGQGIIYGGSYPSGGQLFGSKGGLNNFGYNNSEENALIAATHTPYPNQAINLQHFYKYEVYTAEQLPNLWTNQTSTIVAVQKNVYGVNRATVNAVVGIPLMNYWWVGQ